MWRSLLNTLTKLLLKVSITKFFIYIFLTKLFSDMLVGYFGFDNQYGCYFIYLLSF